MGLEGQKGVSALEMLSYALVGGFALLVLIRLTPAYVDNYKVRAILSSLDERPTIRRSDPAEVTGWIRGGFQVNGLRDIPGEAVKVRREGAFLAAEINYERRIDLISNVDVVLSFENSWKIKQQ